LHKSVPSFGEGSVPLARRDDYVEDDENEDVAGYFEESQRRQRFGGPAKGGMDLCYRALDGRMSTSVLSQIA